MLTRLRADHRGPTHGHHPDVPFAETLARHAKPIADDVSEAQLRDRYRPRDLLPGGIETVIGADSALRQERRGAQEDVPERFQGGRSSSRPGCVRGCRRRTHGG
jgi:hypothetical protein